MTKYQRIVMMADWWPKACRAQGWNPNDREKRMEVLSQAVGRQLDSASDLNNTGDIDRVKAYLGMLTDNVAATVEVDDPLIGSARRKRVKIGGYLDQLTVYLGRENAQKYLAEIIGDKCNRGSKSLLVLTVQELTDVPSFVETRNGTKQVPSQLDQVMMTLSRAVQNYRVKAGDSISDMEQKVSKSFAHVNRPMPTGCSLPGAENVSTGDFENSSVLDNGSKENNDDPY